MYYGVEGARYGFGLPGWYNSVPTELHGQVRLAHDSFEIGAGDVSDTFENPDVISLNSILIPKASRIIGGYMACEQLTNVINGSVHIDLGPYLADLTGATPTLSMYTAGAVRDIDVDTGAIGAHMHTLVPWEAGVGPYINRLPTAMAVWVTPEIGTVTTVLNQTGSNASIGIYYVT